jgi:hypothetical protein
MTPGHDPTLLAWCITVAYFGAGALTIGAARSTNDQRDRIFWWACAGLLVLLGFNKQLDLQGYVTTAGRSLAKQQGWFAERRLVQAAFIVILCAIAAAVLAALGIWLRRSSAAVKVAALGIVLLVAFIVWRAASFHHMDVWVTHEIAGMRSGWWLELAGILVLGLSAFVYLRRNRGAPAPL